MRRVSPFAQRHKVNKDDRILTSALVNSVSRISVLFAQRRLILMSDPTMAGAIDQ
jgi:hypothetical protein